MPGIQLTGLSSGLDTAAIIDSLMAIERLPRQRLSYQQVAAEAKRTALTDIQTKLSSLKTAASDLSSALTWSDTQSLTISDAAKLGATKAGGVGPGTYNFEITQMAAAERRTYGFMTPGVPVTLTIGSGATSSTVDLDFDSTIDDAVARINANADTGVFAVKVGAEIVLASRTTGAASTISLFVDDGGGRSRPNTASSTKGRPTISAPSTARGCSREDPEVYLRGDERPKHADEHDRERQEQAPDPAARTPARCTPRWSRITRAAVRSAAWLWSRAPCSSTIRRIPSSATCGVDSGSGWPSRRRWWPSPCSSTCREWR